MNIDLLIIALMAGAANWAFRYLPTRFDLSTGGTDSLIGRLMAATGPAAIATLFVASILPAFQNLPDGAGSLAAGLVSVLAVYGATRSVVSATFAGALAYGAAFWLIS